MINVKTREAIDEFNITKNSTNVGEIYDSLERLRPDKLSSNTIVQLVRYIESFANKNIISAQHYNSFGTGGDKIKTINISTIASIIASNFLNVYKVGTKAVTSLPDFSFQVLLKASKDLPFAPGTVPNAPAIIELPSASLPTFFTKSSEYTPSVRRTTTPFVKPCL